MTKKRACTRLERVARTIVSIRTSIWHCDTLSVLVSIAPDSSSTKFYRFIHILYYFYLLDFNEYLFYVLVRFLNIYGNQ